jgi:hypothetical protein
MERLIRATTTALLVLFTSGCLGFLEPDFILPGKRMKVVRERAEWYGNNLRFGRIDYAATMVRQENREAFLEMFAGTRVKFTSFDVMNVVPGETRMTAEVWATYEFYLPPSLRQHTVNEKQTWHFDAVRRSWSVEPDLAVFPLLSDGAAVSSPKP